MKPTLIFLIIGVVIMALAAVWALFGLRSRPVAIADLKFPVVVIHDNKRIFIRRDAEDLQRLHVAYAIQYDAPPTLIDSDLNVFSMDKLHSTKSGLWLMINPTGITPIAFELMRQREHGLEQAKKLILDCKYIGGDEEQKRAAIAKESSLAGMIGVLEMQRATQPNE